MRGTETLSRLRVPILFTGILALLVTGFNYRKSFMYDGDYRSTLEQENQESKRMLETSKRIARQQADSIK